MILYLWAAVLVVVAFLYILVCTTTNNSGILSKSRKIVFKSLPNQIQKVHCCSVLINIVSKFIHYVFFTKNRIVQSIYVLLAVGGFYVYIIHGFPLVPNQYLGSSHKITGSILVLLCYYSYYKASATDPGFITQENKQTAFHKFEFDYVLFEDGNICRTCNFEKPARSKHCSVCNKCC